MDSGGLVRSITWKRVRGGVWIGTNYRSKKGVNIARVHEKGATIEVTDAMRKGFVAVIGRRIKKTTKYIRIPARPFISPIMNDKKLSKKRKYCTVRQSRRCLENDCTGRRKCYFMASRLCD